MAEDTKSKVTIYTDGACKSNPGKGGYGAILTFIDSKGQYHEKELTAGYALTTNNRMELMGAIVALEALKKPSEVLLISDSKYLVDAIRNKWLDSWQAKNWRTAGKSPVKNVDLWKRLIEAMKPHEITFEWIKGHAGHEYNERCDELATGSCENEVLLVDEGFKN